MRIAKCSLFLVAILSVGIISSTFAQGQNEATFPTRDVQVVVNAGAGGGTDTINRKIISIIQKNHKDVTLYVTNNPASGEAAGPYDVMRSKADGYTIGSLTYGSVVGSVYLKLIPQYDLSKLNLFCTLTQESDALMVKYDSKYNTFDDYIAAAKANPGKVKIGITTIGARASLLATKIEKTYGITFNQVQYEGAASQREALLNGEVDGVITSLGDFSSVILNKQVKGLVEFSTIQNKAFPDVPPIKSLGHEELASGSFIIMAVPTGTPSDVVDKLSDLYKEAQQSQEFQDWAISIGVTPSWMDGTETTAFAQDTQEKAFVTLDQMKTAGLL